ncbi:MAG: hypothetical protein JWQ22_2166 [Devosia sp.]|nr:hypothetical protein [Devosia sp.]
MADYKELLRRAVSALPENNGAARRAVYEKARSALVGQLRAITPPLPAREITQHRLQLEDCIRQVEQEASEAVITLGRDNGLSPRSSAPPPTASRPEPEAARPVDTPKPVEAPKVVEAPRAVEPTRLVDVPQPAGDLKAVRDAMSIEDIISQAAETSGAPVRLVKQESPAEKPAPELRSIPSIVARAEASKTGPSSPLPQAASARPSDAALKAPSFEARREPFPQAANSMVEPTRSAPRVDPSMGNQAVARQQVIAPIAIGAVAPVERALSTVREVEVERDPSEAEGAIERAIETLDREARGESTSTPPERSLDSFAMANAGIASDDSGFAEVPPPSRGGGGLTIFLVVFAILLAGVGGAGFWAWREGYVDLDQMFGQAQTPVTETADTTTTPTPTLDPVQPVDSAVGPGNTSATTATDQIDPELSGLSADERLEPTPQAVQPTGSETVLPDIGANGEIKSEERLPGIADPATAANDPAASVDPAVLAGSQSLLLEASQDGTTGAVPFSGTVEWTEGVDELGLPTLKGTASIPARNLGVDITIRKNSDPSLPASHLMEVDFKVSDTFIGGTIANLPGVLLKDEELVPGTALVGASARVVGNSFLFALSATPADATTNTDLLENRRWVDLAVVYGTGRNAIITLEKDDTAQALFDKVFATWAQ